MTRTPGLFVICASYGQRLNEISSTSMIKWERNIKPFFRCHNLSLLILSANYQRITSILSESGTQNYLHILLKLTELFRTVSITASIYFPSGLTGNTSESFSSCPMVYAKKGLKKQRQSIMNTYCFIPIKCIFIGVPAIRATSCSMIKDLFPCSIVGIMTSLPSTTKSQTPAVI